MNDEIKIMKTTETDLGWEFEINVDGRLHYVTLTDDYYSLLTAGNITPQELVERSFAFLLSHEPASSILSEFDLKLINTYFPEFEKEIVQ